MVSALVACSAERLGTGPLATHSFWASWPRTVTPTAPWAATDEPVPAARTTRARTKAPNALASPAPTFAAPYMGHLPHGPNRQLVGPAQRGRASDHRRPLCVPSDGYGRVLPGEFPIEGVLEEVAKVVAPTGAVPQASPTAIAERQDRRCQGHQLSPPVRHDLGRHLCWRHAATRGATTVPPRGGGPCPRGGGRARPRSGAGDPGTLR